MNPGQIAERFIRAAEIERTQPGHEGPQPPRSVQLPYVHDWIDKSGWRKEKGDKLTEDPLAEERRLFWERFGLRASASELSQLEELRQWLLAVEDEGQRRALLAWAMAKAGGRSFKRWCLKVEGIHPETGRRRKDRALTRISAHLSRNGVQDSQNDVSGVLPGGPEIGHVSSTLEEEDAPRRHANWWAADGAFTSIFSENPADFSWARKRNELRRQRLARRRSEKPESPAASKKLSRKK